MKKVVFGVMAVVVAVSTVSVLAAPREDVDSNVWRIKGVQVTATAAQLNAAAATATTSAGDLTSGNLALARMTNAFNTLTGTLITNTCLAADGKTNTFVWVPMGDKYVVKSITTSP